METTDSKITSLQNPLVKRFVHLRDKRDRMREGVFVIEGEAELTHAVTNGVEFESVLYCPNFLPGNDRVRNEDDIWRLFARAGRHVQRHVVSESVFAKIAYRQRAGGMIATAYIPDWRLEDYVPETDPLVLIIEGVEKPGNLGALLRTADSVGADAVIVCDPAADLFNPNVVRASLGALFTVPVFVAGVATTVAWLQEQEIMPLVTTPLAEMDYYDADLTVPVALVLGSEKQGVSEFWLQGGHQTVKIPMCGHMDSLNLSCSGAILMYEALRQRQQG